jgi:hypothetical protein
LLLFRIGDFFELFDEDARVASNILGLTLTHRGPVPMAGMPHHAMESLSSASLRPDGKVRCATRWRSRARQARSALPDARLYARYDHRGPNIWRPITTTIFGPRPGRLTVGGKLAGAVHGEWVVAATDKKQDLLTFLTCLARPRWWCAKAAWARG